MTSTLVDTNVLLDLLGGGRHFDWSAGAMKHAIGTGSIILSPVVWSELGGMNTPEPLLKSALSWLRPVQERLTFEAAFRAGQAHASYRRRGGRRDRTLPDFLIGAQAEAGNHALLTRDPNRYRGYFPSLPVIAPDTHP